MKADSLGWGQIVTPLRLETGGHLWRKLKQRLKAEGNEVVTICHGLKL